MSSEPPAITTSSPVTPGNRKVICTRTQKKRCVLSTQHPGKKQKTRCSDALFKDEAKQDGTFSLEVADTEAFFRLAEKLKDLGDEESVKRIYSEIYLSLYNARQTLA